MDDLFNDTLGMEEPAVQYVSEALGSDELAELADKYKRQHGKVTVVAVEEEEGKELLFWFKAPDMKVLAAFTSMAKANPLGAIQMLFKNCLINTEMARYADQSDIVLAVGQHLQELVKKKPSASRSF